MKLEANIELSSQAKLIIENLNNIDLSELFNWFIENRKIFIGGGDIISFLEYKKDLKK